MLASCPPSQWSEFLSISPDFYTKTDAHQKELLPSQKDCFVGENVSKTLMVQNGTVGVLRDVVILGDVSIEATDPKDKENSPVIRARNIFITQNTSLRNIELCYEKFQIFPTAEAFRKEARNLFLRWTHYQRQSVNQIGLRSILV